MRIGCVVAVGCLLITPQFASAQGLTVAAASVTYQYVEAPMIRVGRHLAAHAATRLNGPLSDGSRRAAAAG